MPVKSFTVVPLICATPPTATVDNGECVKTAGRVVTSVENGTLTLTLKPLNVPIAGISNPLKRKVNYSLLSLAAAFITVTR